VSKEAREPIVTTLDPFRLASGLLWNDRAILLPCLLVLSLSTGLQVLQSQLGFSVDFGAVALERLLQIAVVTFICVRWRRLLHTHKVKTRGSLGVFTRLAVIGFVVSFVLTSPSIGIVSSRNSTVAAMSLLLLILGCAWVLRVYFYFAAVSIYGLGIRSGLERAVAITHRSPAVAIRSLLAPIGLTLLFVSLCLAPAPDGRSLVWTSIASCAENVFWILSTYSGLGYALVLFDDIDWRAAGLDHYRTERLLTLQAQGSLRVARWLSPRQGALTLVVALCIAGGNLARQLQQPPAAQVTVARVWTSDYLIKVELSLEDSAYRFRGFNPAAFSIASKTGFSQSQELLAASRTPDGKDILGAIEVTAKSSAAGEKQVLYLTFRSSKTGEALRALDNMWLWYKLAPLVAISPELLAQSSVP
jgi:hypothetical protein